MNGNALGGLRQNFGDPASDRVSFIHNNLINNKKK
jgi:hypothetical protein